MSLSIVYDLSRLVTRVLNATPNGIDRIDLLLARHFLSHPRFKSFALGLGFTAPRLLSKKAAHGAVERAAAAWREDLRPATGSPAYEAVVARLCGHAPESGAAGSRIVVARPGRSLHIAHAILRHLPPQGRSPTRTAPHGAVYFNATHFPLEWKRHVAWLDRRQDIRPVFWIHDLLPVERPDWFWGREPLLHAQRLDLLARRGAAAVVASAAVGGGLRDHMERRGRKDLPIFQLSPPVAAIFATPRRVETRLANIPFYIMCGTIEPRKNHLLLLRVWRYLVKKLGPDAPRLVIIGKRGWKNAEIIAALDDETLRDHVIEVAGLPTPDYKRLLDHCRALLAPSFAEGFGLPVAEAIAAGAAVIASDIAPFREQAGGNIVYLDPQSDEAWRKAIVDGVFSVPARRSWGAPQAEAGASRFDSFDDFLKNLAP
jgi:glycosyltransferase involved in cell wall biosynthesis